MSIAQNPILEEKLDLNKKEFVANVKIIQELQAIFQIRLEIEQQYLNSYQKLAKVVENFNKNYFQFCPDLFSPFESFHAIQLEQKQRLVQSLEADIVQPIKTQSSYILNLEQNLYMNCKSIIDNYNSLFLDIPKIKNEYITTREEVSSAWESLNTSQMNSTSLKTIEKCQKKFHLTRSKKQEKMDLLHQKLKNLRHSNRFYVEMESELDQKYENLEQQKSDLVFDSISKYFVSEVHYMTSLQYDFKNILAKLSDEEGKDKIKLLRLSQIDQPALQQSQSITESSKPLGQTFNQFLDKEAANKFKLKAMDFLKKMSNQPIKESKSDIISFQVNELDGILNDEWKMVLKEYQEREERKQKQLAEELQKQQIKKEEEQKNNQLDENPQNNNLQSGNEREKGLENDERQLNKSDSSDNNSYQYFDQSEINQALD